MDDYSPVTLLVLFFSLLLSSLISGGKTSHRDEDIDDYWSDG